MLPSNPIETMDVYAAQSQYVTGPDTAAQAKGTVPLDTLPADWWNWLWKQITMRINEASSGVGSVYEEILNVLKEASITPSETSTTDLVNAIKAIAHTPGSGTIAGAVKSSSVSGQVAIDADGYMTPNGMGNPTALNTTAKVIVNAINEVLISFNNYKTTSTSLIEGLENNKASKNHASSDSTYGVGSVSNYGHVRLSDSVSSTSSSEDGVAATPKAVKEVKDTVDSLRSALTLPAGVVVPFAGATVPTGWLLCDGQSVSRTSYPELFAAIGTTYGTDAEGTTFKVPDLREATPVGVGKRASGVTNHNALTLGAFQDDQFSQHTHTFTGASHSHTFTGTAASHTHTFTPSGTISGGSHSHTVNSHTHDFSWTGSHFHNEQAMMSMDSSGYGFPSRLTFGSLSNKTGTATGYSLKATSYTFPTSGFANYDLNTTSTELTVSGTTGSASPTTTATTPSMSFKGTAGTTGSTSVTPSGTVNSTTAVGTNANTGATAGGTHGKLLGMNYIIKT